MQITLAMHKPTTRKDFERMSVLIRGFKHSHELNGQPRVTFSAAGFKVSCLSSPWAVESLADSLLTARPVKPTPAYKGPRTPTWHERLRRNRKDRENYYQLLELYNDQQTNQKGD